MSGNRSRKSKLVPRIYIDLDDEDSNNLSEVKHLQPEKKTKLLDDGNDILSNSRPSKLPPPMELCVKVEVEEFDEDFDFEDDNIDANNLKDDYSIAASNVGIDISNINPKGLVKDDKGINNKLVSKKQKNQGTKSKQRDCSALPECQPSTSKKEEPNNICRNKGAFLQNLYSMSHKTARSVKQCKIPVDVILDDLEDLCKTTNKLADKVLEVEMRNAWGRVRYHRHVRSEVDVLILNALIEWKDWTMLSTMRDSPLIYKCYICLKAWWNLHPFQEHIVGHVGGTEQLKVTIEVNYHVAHLIAYYGDTPKMYDIEMDSDCWRCGKPFDVHKQENRNSGVFYSCKCCPERFFTCHKLLFHEGVCLERRKTLSMDKERKCGVCKVSFFSKDDLCKHLVNAHSVRSDLPMVVNVKTCQSCDEVYAKINLHTCPVKNKNYTCDYCTRRFSSPILLKIHIKNSSEDASCRICHMKLQRKCMEMSHVVTHSTNYKLLYKCVLCSENILFFDESSIKKHHTIVHMKKYDKRRFYCEMVIVSKRCIEQHTVEQLDIVASTSGQIQIVAKPNNEKEECNIEDIKHESKTANKISKKSKSNAANNEIQENNIFFKTEIEENDQSHHETVSDGDSNYEPVQIKVENIDDEIEDSLNEFNVNKLIKNDDSESFGYEDLLSSVFRASKHIDTAKMLANSAVEVKQEPSDDEYFEDDIIILTNHPFESDSVKLERDSPNSSINEASTSKSLVSPRNSPIDELKSSPDRLVIIEHTYRCGKCNHNFSSLKLYLIHFKVHGLVNKSCPDCKVVFNNHSKLGVHIKTHVRALFVREKVLKAIDGEGIEEFQLKCTKCDKLVIPEKHFEHWDSHLDVGEKEDITFGHETLEESKDDNMDKEMIERSLEVSVVQEIIDTLTKKTTQSKKDVNRFCNICNHTFTRIHGYKRHLIEHLLMDSMSSHDRYTALKCQICDDKFEKSDQFRLHLRDHADLPVYKCDLCMKHFSDSSNYSKHKKTHDFNLFQCDICMKRFHNMGTMSKHLESHENNDPITCKCCYKIFYSDSSYKKHMRSKEKRNDKYRCKLCKKKFQTLKQQWDHSWITHKIRRHKADCPICNASFRKYMDVKIHLRKTHGVHDKHLSLVTSMLFKDKKKGNDNVDEPKVDVEEGDKEELLIVYDDE